MVNEFLQENNVSRLQATTVVGVVVGMLLGFLFFATGLYGALPFGEAVFSSIVVQLVCLGLAFFLLVKGFLNLVEYLEASQLGVAVVVLLFFLLGAIFKLGYGVLVLISVLTVSTILVMTIAVLMGARKELMEKLKNHFAPEEEEEDGEVIR